MLLLTLIMNREFEIPAPSRDTSELQARINGIAQLEQLEIDGIHAHTIMESLDPTREKIITEEVHKLRVKDNDAT
jgi:hypothetical protein